MKKLDDIDCFLLDMDGTIYLGGQLIEGSLAFLETIKKRGKQFIFITNNSSRNRNDYFVKLKNLGIQVELDNIFTSGEATTIFLHEKKSNAKVFLMGTKSLEDEFTQAGFQLIKERGKEIDFVVLGFDTTLTYEKIWIACDYIRDGVPFFATHPDLNCPLGSEKLMPDTGSMIKMFEAATGVSPIIIGKPYKPLIDAVANKYHLDFSRIAMVGDRLNTDVMLGKNAGITSVLVFSGATTKEEYSHSAIKADFALESVKEIFQQ